MAGHYFPGGNTTEGFFSYYDYILPTKESEYIYTIKGGPGVGKSTFMKKLADVKEKKGHKVSYYHCSSDPDSLDGILDETKNILYMDGTSPHIRDPRYPIAYDKIIDLSQFLDEKKLKKKRKKISELTDETSNYFISSYDYLKSLISIYDSCNKFFLSSYNENAVNKKVKSLISEITKNKEGKGYKERKLFLSAITPKGFINFIDETINSRNIYIIDGKCGDLSHIILEKLSYELKMLKYSYEVFYCPIFPKRKIEHIIIPELDTAIITSNEYHNTEKKGTVISTNSLFDIKPHNRDDYNFNKELITKITDRAISNIKKAKTTHDHLEKYYINAMDFDALSAYTDKFIK